MRDFSIPSGADLFPEGSPPTPQARMNLRQNTAYIALSDRIKAYHHEQENPAIRATLVLVGKWMEEAATPPEERKKEAPSETSEAFPGADELPEI